MSRPFQRTAKRGQKPGFFKKPGFLIFRVAGLLISFMGPDHRY
jgi:hypothetical protein